MICDPPFGIEETKFDQHYKRKESTVMDGYVEAPSDYRLFTYAWLREAKRALKYDGSLYVISGWNRLGDVLNALDACGFFVRNHIIWKYNFGVYTKNKFVTSHYHIIYATKGEGSNPTFNRFCRFGPGEKEDGKSLNYKDMEDVWYIKKEYHPNKKKNKNKLPDELIRKMILYSSNEEDVICDFFMGNFTTASVGIRLGRIPIGFELNKESYDYYMNEINDIDFGCDLIELKKTDVDLPINQGKPITTTERVSIMKDFNFLIKSTTKKDVIVELSKKYGRGKFSIINILDGS